MQFAEVNFLSKKTVGTHTARKFGCARNAGTPAIWVIGAGAASVVQKTVGTHTARKFGCARDAGTPAFIDFSKNFRSRVTHGQAKKWHS
ncbi:hypothetical protein EHQ12_08835 [Leptospira gomenensis]|uniref:hypothetical protein n=1 Tax=Leptospira gomenensis TaxID=2484974 RepID=UPI00109101FD|nr:hypothetical protein [Leptospira gomenensis]TGK39421.1 hypothetical protein EHQ12_08835 [Leptospira gomenensis]